MLPSVWILSLMGGTGPFPYPFALLVVASLNSHSGNGATGVSFGREEPSQQ
jgi:hypothetical protein